MAGIGARFTIERVMIGNYSPKVARACALLDPLPFSPCAVLSQSESGYTGLAVIEGFNHTDGFPIQRLNAQFYSTFSWQPQFKKPIPQGGNSLINQHFSVLVNSSYIELLFGQFPLTGGHIMNYSLMCPRDVRGHSHHHAILWKCHPFRFSVREFEYDLSGRNVALDLIPGPLPLVGDRHGLRGVSVIQSRLIW
jgi:hypothetical protein